MTCLFSTLIKTLGFFHLVLTAGDCHLLRRLHLVCRVYQHITVVLTNISHRICKNFVQLEQQTWSKVCRQILEYLRAASNWAYATPEEISESYFIKDKHRVGQRNSIIASKVIKENYSLGHAALQSVRSCQSNMLIKL